jgi:hypothetical protein
MTRKDARHEPTRIARKGHPTRHEPRRADTEHSSTFLSNRSSSILSVSGRPRAAGEPSSEPPTFWRVCLCRLGPPRPKSMTSSGRPKDHLGPRTQVVPFVGAGWGVRVWGVGVEERLGGSWVRGREFIRLTLSIAHCDLRLRGFRGRSWMTPYLLACLSRTCSTAPRMRQRGSRALAVSTATRTRTQCEKECVNVPFVVPIDPSSEPGKWCQDRWGREKSRTYKVRQCVCYYHGSLGFSPNAGVCALAHEVKE